MKKRLIYHLFLPSLEKKENFNNTNARKTEDIVKMLNLHIACLHHYSKVFDDAIFVIAKESGITDDEVGEIERRIIMCGFHNVNFIVRNNNVSRGEGETYRDFAIGDKEYDGLTFYYHTKGLTHEFSDSMIDWATALWFFNLEYVNEIETALTDERFNYVTSGIFQVSDYEDKRNFIYSGNALWYNNKRLQSILSEKPRSVFNIDSRWWCEAFVGKVVPSSMAHSIGNFTTEWDDYHNAIDHIRRCVDNVRLEKYLEFKNNVALNWEE